MLLNNLVSIPRFSNLVRAFNQNFKTMLNLIQKTTSIKLRKLYQTFFKTAMSSSSSNKLSKSAVIGTRSFMLVKLVLTEGEK